MTAQLDAALHSERLERLSGLARNCDQLRGGWKETTSGAKDDRAQRNEVMTLAQARDVDVVLVSELTR